MFGLVLWQRGVLTLLLFLILETDGILKAVVFIRVPFMSSIRAH